MKTRSHVLACLVLALAAGTAFAAPKGDAADRQARKAERAALKAEKQRKKAQKKAAKSFTKQYQLPAEELAKQVDKLQRELSWHSDLDEARQAAIEANKPILWIQALGDLSGLL